MAGRKREPSWFTRIVIDSIQSDQIREHGGLAGIRDENGLEAALERPRNKWANDGVNDLASLAAAYGFGIAKNHPYRDGNKRVTFLAIVTFLGMNGSDFDATDADVVTAIAESCFRPDVRGPACRLDP